MNENKERKGLVIVIVILTLFLVGAGGYIYYLSTQKVKETDNSSTDKSLKNDSNKVTSCDETLDVTGEEGYGLLKTINYNNNGEDIDIYFTDKKVVLSDINPDLVTMIALKQLNKSNEKGYAFTSDELHEQIGKLFGKDYKYEDKSITDTCPQYNYDQATKRYEPSEIACGGEGGPGNIKKVAKVIKNSKQLEIYVRVLFIGNNDCNYFYDYAKTKNTSYNCENIDFYEDGIISNAALYKITFTNDGSNYVFTSSEPVNN